MGYRLYNHSQLNGLSTQIPKIFLQGTQRLLDNDFSWDYNDVLYIYIYMHQALPPPPSPPPHGMGPILRSSPSPPVVWWGCGTVPLPPCGVVGVWYGMLGMYGVYGRSGMACLESMDVW